MKDDKYISSLIRPPQSPDLNLTKGVWNILKPRIHKRTWRTIEELKAILQEEWSKITIEEVRRRIREMPERCEKLIKWGSGPVKSDVW
jgi:transposase